MLYRSIYWNSNSKLATGLYALLLIIGLLGLSIIGYPIFALACIVVATIHGSAKMRGTFIEAGNNLFFGGRARIFIAITVCVYIAIAILLALTPKLSEALLSPVWAIREHLIAFAGKERLILIATLNPLDAASQYSMSEYVPLLSSVFTLPISQALYFVKERHFITEYNKITSENLATVEVENNKPLARIREYLLISMISVPYAFISWFWLVFAGAVKIHWAFDHGFVLLSALAADAITALAVNYSGLSIALIAVFFRAERAKSILNLP